jgi:predicted RNA-binding Zn ribbon-like protein
VPALDTYYTGYMSPRRTFEFKAGARCLDLVDTVAARASTPVELLSGTRDLDRWLHLAGLAPESVCCAGAGDLMGAKLLREAIYRAAKAITEGAAPDERDVRLINALALKPPARPQLKGGVVTYYAVQAIEAALSALAADAIECFSVKRRDRIRKCRECQMLFFDTSRPGRRMWCSSASGCGNRAKVRRHRERASHQEEA